MSLAAVDLNLRVVLGALLIESGMTRAALRVGLSQSATRHALSRLRRLLGNPLLVRTPGGMALTPRAIGPAAPVRGGLEPLEQPLAPPEPFDPKQSRQCFNLAFEDAAQVGRLALLAERLKLEAPGVDLRIQPASAGLPAEAHATGSLDPALAVSAATAGETLARGPELCAGYTDPAEVAPGSSPRYGVSKNPVREDQEIRAESSSEGGVRAELARPPVEARRSSGSQQASELHSHSEASASDSIGTNKMCVIFPFECRADMT